MQWMYLPVSLLESVLYTRNLFDMSKRNTRHSCTSCVVVGKFQVTNLGACGSTMLKGGDSPYWKRPQYASLTNNTWDVITIMLGTNDAKDPNSGGPNNWYVIQYILKRAHS